jgi:predicted transposase/invertase (TIGR01784 family)
LTANEKQSLLDATDDELWLYLLRKEMYEHDQVSRLNNAQRKGERRGEKKGLETAKLEIARNLLAEGSTTEFVHKITGLDMETIENL